MARMKRRSAGEETEGMKTGKYSVTRVLFSLFKIQYSNVQGMLGWFMGIKSGGFGVPHLTGISVEQNEQCYSAMVYGNM